MNRCPPARHRLAVCPTTVGLLSIRLLLFLGVLSAGFHRNEVFAAESSSMVQLPGTRQSPQQKPPTRLLEPLHPGDMTYRRVFVPADAPEAWPVGSERYLPIPHIEFSRLAAQNQSSTAKKPQVPIHVSRAVYRAELVSDDLLRGEAEWTVDLPADESPDQVAQWLPLTPMNLAIRSARWRRDPAQAASFGLRSRQEEEGVMELAVLASQSDTLQLQWQLAAEASSSARAEFVFRTPIFVPQTLELVLPADRSATLSGGELLQTDSGPPGKNRSVFQLGPDETHRIQISQLAPPRTTRRKPLVSQVTSYQLEPSGVTVITRLRLDARESPCNELKATGASGLRIVEVKIDQQPVAWRMADSAGETALLIPRPESRLPQTVEIRALAKFRPDAPWPLPKLRFDDVAWTEGTTRVLVSPGLELRRLTPRQSTLQHIVGIADDAAAGEVLRLQEWSPEATLEIEVGRPLPNLSARTATTIELEHDSKARIVAALSTSGGNAYQVLAVVAAGWTVDSVTTTPSAAMNEWHIDRDGASSRLRFQLNQPISKGSALRVEIEARKTTGKSVLPATVGQLKLLRFLGTGAPQQLLLLRSRESKPLTLADHLERARLAPDQITSDYRDLLPKSPAGPLIDLSSLNDAEVIEFQPQPAKYEANLQIEVDALPDSFQHHYRIDYRLQSGAVSEIIVQLDEPLPQTLQWMLVGRSGTIASERIDAAPPPEVSAEFIAAAAVETASASAATYRLRLPAGLTEDFRIQASYSRPAQPTEACNLISLPQSIDWGGQVVLRGALDRFQVFDQGWTPTIYSNNEVAKERLPVLGTYRLGPEELRLGSTPTKLRCQRLRQEQPAPQMIAWLAEYRTLQAANGAAIHTASYSLENLGIGEAEIILPAGAELQEAWLNNQRLEPKQISSAGNVNQLRFGNRQHWPYLVLKYATRAAPLGGSTSLQPVLPQCSFPVNLGRWTLWAPEQYEIDSTQSIDSHQRYHWWKRVFGPLARSRGETVFNPVSRGSWAELWSAPLAGQQTKQIAEKLAGQFVSRLQTDTNQPLGILLNDLTAANQATELFYVDRMALLARGIQANTTCQELAAASAGNRLHNTQSLPLSSHRLGLLVSPGMIVLTTAERIAHWHDQLRPTDSSDVFLVSSDDFVDSLEKLRSAGGTGIADISRWQNSPAVETPQWASRGAMELADVGRPAQTVDFIDGLPTLTVRRAFVQRALWYAMVLLSLVLGVWQLAHYPSAMILIGAMAGSACFIVPANWLTIPQAVFLGLVAAAIVRATRKSLYFGEVPTQIAGKVAPARTTQPLTAKPFLAVFLLCNCLAPQIRAQPVAEALAVAVDETTLPRVLVPIDSQGNQQGEDIYLSEEFLATLQRSPRQATSHGAELVLLTASYRGSLPGDFGQIAAADHENLTDPWILRWKVASYLPNCRLILPLQRNEAIWAEDAHRLDGMPVKLLWQPDGNGCSVVCPTAGVHWLQLECRPRFTTNDRSARLRLHVPPLPGAALDLSLAPDVNDLRVFGAGRTATARQATPAITGDHWPYLLGDHNTIDLRWASNRVKGNAASWERLEQLSWLHVDPAAARLDVQLSVTGLQAASSILELDVSAQLKLVPPGEDSPIAEAISPTASHPTRLRLRLRPGLPADLVVPLQFELQREVSVGTLFFPRVRWQGSPLARNLFAVSVAAGLSYDEKVSSNLRTIEPAEFSATWNTAAQDPLYAYALGQEDPEWSLRVWPDPQSFSAQQTLRVHCLPNEARVDFEAVIDSLTGTWLTHRLQVPASLQIATVTVQNQVDSRSVPVRWSRSVANQTEVVVFFGRPLQQPHLLKLQGVVKATTDQEVELPQVRLLDGARSEIHMDLFRTEDVRVSWLDSRHIPQEVQQQRVSRSKDEIYLGHFSWRSSETGKLSGLRLERNKQRFETSSVTTVDLAAAGWTACLNSHVTVRQGVVSRLSLTAPDNFRPPYDLQPEQVGVIDDVRETSGGKEITVLLSLPATEGDEVEVQFSGSLSLSADRRLVIPSLQWSGATGRDRFVLLPSLIDGRSIEWQRSGLRRQALPEELSGYAAKGEAAHAFHIEQDQFQAEERSDRGTLRNALVRYAKVSGIIDEAGLLISTAELVLQPGRSTACELQLPPHSQLIQLIVGDHPVRRELLPGNRWKVPLGAPFMPQRIVASYRSWDQLLGQRLELVAPKILLGSQSLPAPQTWWRIQAASDLQLRNPAGGRLTDEFQFAMQSYRLPLLVFKDALSPALELPRQAGRAWLQTWESITRKAEVDWQTLGLSENREFDLSTAHQARLKFVAAFAADDLSLTTRQLPLTYPPGLPLNPEVPPTDKRYFFVSDSGGQLALHVTRSTQGNLRRWLAAFALVSGVLAIVLRLRHNPYWHHQLCHWPHSLALGGGFVWWLLLKPSAIGMLVIALALASLAIRQWRLFRQQSPTEPTGHLRSTAFLKS